MAIKNLLSFLILTLLTIQLSAQIKDSVHNESDPNYVKQSGFAWGGTPILAYDADLGLRYGAVINLFDYGKGERFPDYDQYFKLKIFNSTKGTSHLSGLFESYDLIKGINIQAEAALVRDIALDFFGFNGIESRFNNALINPESSYYLNKHFYKHRRIMSRIKADFQLPIMDSGSLLFLGLAFNHYNISDIDYSRLPSPNSKEGMPAEEVTLYKRFSDWGLLDSDEVDGGKFSLISLGYIYDTRINKLNCKSGVWFETYFIHSPALFKMKSFTKHIATFRYYRHFQMTGITGSLRLSSQQRIQGKIPFYALNTFYETRQNQDGLGGAFTLRGIQRNRIASDGFLMANVELRKTVYSFQLAKLRCQIDLSMFSDLAYVTQKYNYQIKNIPDPYQSTNFSSEPQKLALSFGPGLYFIYNSNNIISVNLGYSPNDQLGTYGLYVGSSLLF